MGRLSVRIFRKPRSPFWWYDFRVEGRRHSKSTGATQKPTAQAIADAAYRDALGRAKDRKRDETELMTVETAFGKWWDNVGASIAEQDLGPFSPDDEYRDRPINWLCREIGPRRKLQELRTADVLDVIAKRRARLALDGHDDDGRPVYRRVSDRTVNRTVGKLLRRIINFAGNVLGAEVPGKKQLRWSDVIYEEKLGLERKPLSIQEEAALDDASRPELVVIKRFALATSLRIEEIVTLTWPQVDWENREIRLMQKGEHYRTIPMTMEIEAILRPLKGHHRMAVFTFVARRRAHNKAGEVIREKGKRYPVTYWGIQTARRRDWSAAGGVGFHDLRRTAAKRMDKAVGEEAAQKMLGHANVKTTRIYLRKDTDVEKLRAQMEARDRYVAEQRENAGSGESSRKIGRGKR